METLERFQPVVMALVTNTAYLTSFASGTLLGATVAYYFLRHRFSSNDPHSFKTEEEPWKKLQRAKPSDEYRLVMAIRNDLKMQKGKVAAQCGHAAVAAYQKAMKQRPDVLRCWLANGGTKIAVRVDSEEELARLSRAAEKNGVLACVIRDAGQTQVAPGSKTVLALGPAPKSALDEISGHLKLY